MLSRACLGKMLISSIQKRGDQTMSMFLPQHHLRARRGAHLAGDVRPGIQAVHSRDTRMVVCRVCASERQQRGVPVADMYVAVERGATQGWR